MISARLTTAFRLLAACAAACTVALAPVAGQGVALAAVRHDGAWPDEAKEKDVSLDVSGVSRQEAVKRLADAAGWSVVMPAAGMSPETVDVHVKNQPPSKVLDLILSDGKYVATRDGSIVNIGREAAPHAEPAAEADEPAAPPPAGMPAVPPVPPIPPIPGMHAHGHHHASKHGEDRVVTGGHVTIEKDESVGDVTVLGGNLDVIGEVEGDLAVFGGNVFVRKGAAVHGDAAVIGGSLTIEDDASVDGDVGVVGGSLKRGDKAHIGGSARDDKGRIKANVDVDEDDDDASEATPSPTPASKVSRLASKVGGTVSAAAMFFLFGAMLLALAPPRMDILKAEIAARPLRSVALGVMGAVGAVVTSALLCITLIGIPVAIVGLILGVIAAYAGMTAVLTTAGQAVLGHKTKNPYVHLAAGCLMLLVLGALPWVGTLVKLGVAFAGVGVLFATRLAGLVPERNGRGNPPSDPYRSIGQV